MLIDAYTKSTQGYFLKDSSLVELEKTIKVIMEYWKRCVSPNNFATAASKKIRHQCPDLFIQHSCLID